MSEDEDAADPPGRRHGGDERDESASERLQQVVETLLDNLDLAASFVLDAVQHRIIEPLEAARRQLLLGMVVLTLIGLGSIGLGIWDRQLFLTIFPFFFGATMLIGAIGLYALDRQAVALKERVRELSSKARTWKRVANWARSKL